MKKRVLIIAGPTGLGKGALAKQLARTLGNTELVSCDSAKVWQGLDAGTNKKQEDVGNVHMMDVAPLGSSFSASKYADMAADVFRDVFERGNSPVVYGGSGMYLDWLMNGKRTQHAVVDKQLANEKEEELRRLRDWDLAIEQLVSVDEEGAKRVTKNDYSRLAKALLRYEANDNNVVAYTNERTGSLQTSEYDIRAFLMYPPSRLKLMHRLDWRAEQVWANLLFEMDWHLDVHPELMTPEVRRLIGYREANEFCHYIAREQTPQRFERLLEKYQAANRRLAKRQLTWFRHADRVKQFHWMPFNADDNTVNEVLRLYKMDREEFDESREKFTPPPNDARAERERRNYRTRNHYYNHPDAVYDELERFHQFQIERRQALMAETENKQ